MHNLRRFYYQNKEKIWKIILFIVFCFALLQFANYLAKINNEKKRNQEALLNEQNKTNTSITVKDTYVASNKSAVDGSEISEEEISEVETLINKFVSHCNKGEIEDSYNLLSDECKKELYPSIEQFYNKYVKNNFPEGNKKITRIENWKENIYKIDMSEDVLKTGNINAKSIQDYITIVYQKGENKLNINSLVDVKDIKKTVSEQGVEITVIDKKIYMDYEKYAFKIKNNTEKTILLDNLESTKTIYLIDENGNKYYAYTHEIIEQLLKVNKDFNTQIDIKFYKKYDSKNDIREIVFSNIILDYKDFSNEETEKINFIISL